MTTLQEAARKALAQQELPQKERPDFMAGYDAGMTDAKRMAQHREQQPVCHGCGIPAGDVHMSTCKSGKWPSRVSNGDTAAPAPQAQQGEPVAQARLGMKDGLAMALSVVELYGMKGDVIYREIAKLRDGIAAAPAPRAQPAQEKRPINCGTGHCSCIECLFEPAPQPAQGVGRTNPGDETGGAVERFGWQTFLGKSPEIIPATNGSFVWYSDYLKLWQSAQPAVINGITYEGANVSAHVVSAPQQSPATPTVCDLCTTDGQCMHRSKLCKIMLSKPTT